MADYDFADIEACIARARRMRSEAFAAALAEAWLALRKALAGLFKVRDGGRHGPYLPA